MHRTPPALLLPSPRCCSSRPGRARLVVEPRRQPGLRRRRQRRRDLRERLRRALQPRLLAVDLSGWTVQYASASGDELAGDPARRLDRSPGGTTSSQLASAAAVGAALPTPDATGTTNLAASGGKVALVHDATALACGASAGSCSAVARRRATSSATARPPTTRARRRARADEHDCGAPRRRRLHRHGRERRRLHGRTRRAAQHLGRRRRRARPAPPPARRDSRRGAASTSTSSRCSRSRSSARRSASGTVARATTPSPLSERVTVVSNNAAGYSLTVHRSAFAPADLPLGIAAIAPPGGSLGVARRWRRLDPDRARGRPARRRRRRPQRGRAATSGRPALGFTGRCRRRAGPLHGDRHLHGDRPVSRRRRRRCWSPCSRPLRRARRDAPAASR